jgi:hypothetical protein
MTEWLRRLVAVSVVFVCAAALQPAPSAADANEWLVGSWQCREGSSALTEATGTLTVSRELNDAWLAIRYAADPVRNRSSSVAVNAFWSRDGDRWVSVWLNSFGGWGTSTSDGWAGDTITWLGKRATGPNRLLRSTLARGGDGGFTYREETEREDGGWSRIFDVICRKP